MNANDSVGVDLGRALWFFFAAFLMCTSVVLAAYPRTPMGPNPAKRFNRATLTIGMVFATVTLSIGLENESTLPPLIALLDVCFQSLQMMLANRQVVRIANAGLADWVYWICVVIEYVTYIAAPVSSILTVLDLLTDFMTPFRLRIGSWLHDTYLLVPLNRRTLALARSIRKRDGLACIVFSGTRRGSDPTLASELRGICALQSEEPVEYLLSSLPGKKDLTVVLDDDDGAANIARASNMQRERKQRSQSKRRIKLFAVTSLYGSDTLPVSDAGQPDDKTTIHKVDWTRNLVTSVLDRYPLFLKGECASDVGAHMRLEYLRWQKSMFDDTERHIVIVGAGHVGTEFLRLALSYSRVYGLSFRFDVFDNVIDPMNTGHCVAERLLESACPELLDKKKLREDGATQATVVFHLCDARSVEFLHFLEANSASISYMFVSLGDDTVCAEVAIRARETLERSLVRRCASLGSKERMQAYERAVRPVIVVVLDNEEVASSVTARNRQGQNRRINVAGLPSDMYSYEQMDLGEGQPTAFEDRSTNASRMHGKYRLYAFAISADGRRAGMRLLQTDWKADLYGDLEGDCLRDTSEAIRRFNEFCADERSTGALCQAGHDWLLRMEHSRWNTYMRGEGYWLASADDVAAYLGSCKDDASPHRNDLALLHPCIVPFESLPDVDENVNGLRTDVGLEANDESFQMKNKSHLPVVRSQNLDGRKYKSQCAGRFCLRLKWLWKNLRARVAIRF